MSKVIDVIKAEIIELVTYSKELKHKLDKAKTRIKQDLYRKKLKKNNMILAELLLALDKLDKNKNEQIRLDTSNK